MGALLLSSTVYSIFDHFYRKFLLTTFSYVNLALFYTDTAHLYRICHND